MTLYNNFSEPGLSLSVITDQAAGTIASAEGMSVVYVLADTGGTSDLPPNKPELVTSIDDYLNRIGSVVPTNYSQLTTYLSIANIFSNSRGTGVVQVISVLPPNDIHTVTITAPITAVADSTVSYDFQVNSVRFTAVIKLPGVFATNASDYLAEYFANLIRGNALLRSAVFVRKVTANSIELAPAVQGQLLSFNFYTATATATTLLATADYTWTFNPPVTTTPDIQDYIQALNVGLTEDLPVGLIIAPAFFATSTKEETFELAAAVDSFCRGASAQHLFYIDVPNPDLTNIPIYSTLSVYTEGQAVAAAAQVLFNGNVYEGDGAGIVVTPNIVAATNVPINARVRLPAAVTTRGVTTRVLQSINATAQIAVPATPTSLELTKFVPISAQQLINEALNAGTIVLVEASSASEAGLYSWRDDFDSVEGHVSVAAPYQYYSGVEVTEGLNIAIPASSYLAGLHIYTMNTFGLATPPASDSYPLVSTKGGVWQVTRAGHALLNGKGINIIKKINSSQYIMGSRTLSKLDLYNRLNARAILSVYIRVMFSVLSTGIVLRPLSSSNVALSAIKSTMDAVSQAFFEAGLLDGTTTNAPYKNICDTRINPSAQLAQGVIKAESKITQIGMSEQLTVTIQQALIGNLASIL